MTAHPADLLATLARLDTPTICNALERLDPARSGFGFTRRPLICSHPDAGPRVGYARTAKIRTTPPQGEDKEALTARRFAYFDYVNAGDGPKIAVHQDLDGDEGIAACWGDVMANLHKAMGCVGVVTNGAFRDIPGMPEGIPMLAAGEKPAHGFLHMIAFGEPVEVAGMTVRDGDLLHMDRNGAVVIPAALAPALPEAALQVVEREQRVIALCRAPDFSLERVKAAMRG